MSTPVSTTVIKSVRLIELLSEQHKPMTVSDCATALQMPRATVHRLLVTLRQTGIVVRRSDGGYELGLRLLELGSLAPLRRRLGQVSRTPMKKLTELTGHQAHLGVRSGRRLLFLESIRGVRTNLPTSVGQMGWLHATAMGKVLMAFGPDDVVDDIVADDLPKLTSTTITDVDKLRRQLAWIREEGYAYDDRETRDEVRCLSAPIRSSSGGLLGAVSVTVRSDRQDRDMSSYLSPLLSATKDIESRILQPTQTERPGAASLPRQPLSA